MEKTCFFIGNRNTPSSIKEQLAEVVEKHITEYNVNTFVVGHYGSFDRLAAEVLKEAKNYHPNIKLYLLEPYALSQKIETPDGFNGTFYPEGLEFVPKPFAIVRANRYMIEHSEYLISYCEKIGNTRKFVEYAQKQEKKGLIRVTLL
ncbi:hypothetical protein IJG14_03480 [bacterium]|nr:hypothetical protein [bacterium]